MRRRDFILAVCGAATAAWPLAARAQQPTMPVIGFLNAASSEGYAERLQGFHQGLKDEGFVEGENVAIDYRWADNQISRASAMAAELVRRQVRVIVATASDAVRFPSRNSLHGFQNTDRPIANPEAEGHFAAVSNHCAMSAGSAALPRMI